MLRSFAVLLAVVLLGASRPPSAPATDRVAELAGSWTCRAPGGALSTVAYRAEEGGIIGVETSASGAARATETFRRDPAGGWRVERTTSYSRFSGYGPAWTTGPWIVADAQKHGSEIHYERLDDGALKHTLVIQGRAYDGAVCAKGSAPPDPALCAVPDVPAAVTRAVSPEAPEAAMQSRISGIVDVLVSLDAQGHVINATITRSPSTVLNVGSLAAARASTYQPALHDCKPVPSQYTFTVEYNAG